jgi:dTDP-4-dehydrorhamnose reductase
MKFFACSQAEGEDAVREVFPDAVIIRPGLIVGSEDRYLNWIAQMDRQFGCYPTFFNDSTVQTPVYVSPHSTYPYSLA